ncbi:hypothetical protein QFC24_002265 [Naganishia onofrii]|uniref:Uncharacterized protein n=1 Tax=Naganishia onofrii TaxID=1851511 RepID=A0ACC2XPR0_9TREE|nr:hypothetical protein QFC24_002265 [Naganishia onofrii]
MHPIAAGDVRPHTNWKLKSIHWSPTKEGQASIEADDTVNEWYTSIVLSFYFTNSTATTLGSHHSGEEAMKTHRPRITVRDEKITLASLKDGWLDFCSTGASLEKTWEALRCKKDFVNIPDDKPYMVGLKKILNDQPVQGIPLLQSRSRTLKSMPPEQSSGSVGFSDAVSLLKGIPVDLLHKEIWLIRGVYGLPQTSWALDMRTLNRGEQVKIKVEYPSPKKSCTFNSIVAVVKAHSHLHLTTQQLSRRTQRGSWKLPNGYSFTRVGRQKTPIAR